MKRVFELASNHLQGKLSAKAFRSALVAQLTILDDKELEQLALRLQGK